MLCAEAFVSLRTTVKDCLPSLSNSYKYDRTQRSISCQSSPRQFRQASEQDDPNNIGSAHPNEGSEDLHSAASWDPYIRLVASDIVDICRSPRIRNQCGAREEPSYADRIVTYRAAINKMSSFWSRSNPITRSDQQLQSQKPIDGGACDGRTALAFW